MFLFTKVFTFCFSITYKHDIYCILLKATDEKILVRLGDNDFISDTIFYDGTFQEYYSLTLVNSASETMVPWLTRDIFIRSGLITTSLL